MSSAVKVLSRLQLPADLLAGFTQPAAAGSDPAPDIVMYLGATSSRRRISRCSASKSWTVSARATKFLPARRIAAA